MASNQCPDCLHSSQVIGEQKTKINLIEIRLKDLVKAYKKVCLERDDLLSISSAALLPSNDSQELQKRLSTLEASVANMSAICGEYESQRIKDKQLIQELTLRCEQLILESSGSVKSEERPQRETEEPVRKFRHKGIQTEETIEWTSDDQKDVNNENLSLKCLKDIETQTDIQTETDIFSNINRKKTELAVVLPTVSERQTQSHSDSESDRMSNASGNSLQSVESNLDNYPVFASNDKQITQNNDIPYSGSTHSGVSLFYANELARKEIDLAETRLQARENECALRELQWKYNTEKYRLQSRINELEKNLSQITCTQPMSQLTITYVRNVLLKLLNTKDKQQKQFMINAILTALEPKERKPK